MSPLYWFHFTIFHTIKWFDLAMSTKVDRNYTNVRNMRKSFAKLTKGRVTGFSTGYSYYSRYKYKFYESRLPTIVALYPKMGFGELYLGPKIVYIKENNCQLSSWFPLNGVIHEWSMLINANLDALKEKLQI